MPLMSSVTLSKTCDSSGPQFPLLQILSSTNVSPNPLVTGALGLRLVSERQSCAGSSGGDRVISQAPKEVIGLLLVLVMKALDSHRKEMRLPTNAPTCERRRQRETSHSTEVCTLENIPQASGISGSRALALPRLTHIWKRLDGEPREARGHASSRDTSICSGKGGNWCTQ